MKKSQNLFFFVSSSPNLLEIGIICNFDGKKLEEIGKMNTIIFSTLKVLNVGLIFEHKFQMVK